MTHRQFKQEYYQNMHDEMMFLYGYDTIVKEENAANVWYTTPSFIHHGKRFKKQWHNNMYAQRRIEYSTLKYDKQP